MIARYFRSNGKALITTTVPDTITSWVASAFAVHSQSGLGVSAEQAKVIIMGDNDAAMQVSHDSPVQCSVGE